MPWRAREAEEVLLYREIEQDTVSKTADAAVDNARPLAKNSYKVPLFRGIIEEELSKIALYEPAG